MLHAQAEQLELLTACCGWRLERVQPRGAGGEAAELTLRLVDSDTFRLQLRIGGGEAAGAVELAAGAAPHLPEDRRQLAADMVAAAGLGAIHAPLAGAGMANLRAAVQVGGLLAGTCCPSQT